MFRRGTDLFTHGYNGDGWGGAGLIARVAADGWSAEGGDSFTLLSASTAPLYTSKSLEIASVYATGSGLTTALPLDTVGDFKGPGHTSLLVVTPDEAGDGKGLPPGNPVLTVDAPAHTIGTINTIGDQDFYQVNLVAGQTYQIGMYGYTGGPSGVPNADSYVEIYGSDGTTLLASGDGGANTPANQANSGFDVLMTFIAPTTGTYYINARSFDQDPTNGTTGDGVGDYELFVHNATNDPNVYHPYYTDDSPLYSIDWGTRVNKVNQTAANPDGNEGPRPTGNAQGTPTYNSALNMDAILAANGKTWADIQGKNVVTIYFAKAGEIITSAEKPTSPGLPPAAVETSDVSSFEHLAVMTALHEFEKVADVVYLEVQDKSQADFEYASYKGTPGPGVSLLGSMEPPDEPNEGLALFNSGDYRWNATDLTQGGFSFTTLIHEFGHGNGLAHPHDNGGHSGIMHGVQPDGPVASYTLGEYDLNQAVFTMMSYEDGWQDSPYGNAPTSGGYGYLGSLMALDIAAIQDKYGVNEDWATGDDVYILKDVNAIGTYYSSIWDAGGTDEIKYVGTREANIDLRPASLKYEWGGGGWVSYAYGIYGGFTIANGVTIENATSDAGNDTLTGNDVANHLSAGAGNDVLHGNGGDDILDGGTGADTMDGGTGNDVYLVDDAGDVVIENPGEGTDEVRTTLSSYVLPANVEKLTYVGTADATLHGNALDDVIAGGSGNDFIWLNDGGNDDAQGGAGNDVFLFGAALTAADKVDGGSGNDQIAIQGDYWAGKALTLGTGVVGVESLVLLPGSDTRFGDDGTHSYSYDVTTADANVAAGVTLTVDASRLAAGENFTFNGSAESDGAFFVYGGGGTDTLTGGGKNDVFLFGNGGQWGASDSVDGGAGTDQLALRGNYTITFGADQIHSIESLALMSAFDTRYGSAAVHYDYVIVMNDGNLAAGKQMTVDAGNLRGGETLTFDGSAELDGSFRVFGGQGDDHITGSQGNDILVGALGGDWLDGQGGNDVFRYRSADESSSTHYDTIVGFDSAHDVIDLPVAVSGWGTDAQGSLSDATFDQDLANALAGHMGAHQAVLFTASGGDHAGQTFLIVDADGDGVYQADHDYVIQLVNPAAPVTTADTHIFV